MNEMANERAEILFKDSGLAAEWRRPVSAEARRMMNCTNVRFSDAVGSVIGAVKRSGASSFDSLIARGLASEAGLA